MASVTGGRDRPGLRTVVVRLGVNGPRDAYDAVAILELGPGRRDHPIRHIEIADRTSEGASRVHLLLARGSTSYSSALPPTGGHRGWSTTSRWRRPVSALLHGAEPGSRSNAGAEGPVVDLEAGEHRG